MRKPAPKRHSFPNDPERLPSAAFGAALQAVAAMQGEPNKKPHKKPSVPRTPKQENRS